MKGPPEARHTVDYDNAITVSHEILTAGTDDTVVRLEHEGASAIKKRDTIFVHEGARGANGAYVSACSMQVVVV